MNTEANHDWLTVLVASLRGRGVSFTMRGPNRLIVRPWKLLTDAEQGTVTAARPALKALVSGEGQDKAGGQIVEPEPPLRADYSKPSTLASTSPSTLASTNETVCPYCMRTCVTADHPAYFVLHRYDPNEVKKRDDKAFLEMLATMEYSARSGRRGYKR